MTERHRRVVLVTGAAGFVGWETLAPLRARGFVVHATCRREADVRSLKQAVGAEGGVHRLDLADRACMRDTISAIRPTHLLHCAWYVEHGRFWEAPENDDWVDITLDLADAAARVGLRRFVGVGTCVEYDWQQPDAALPRRETDPLAPTTRYGRCKARTAAALAERLAPLGVDLAWARVFLLHGPREAPGRLVPTIVDALQHGREVTLGPGHYVRDFIAVDQAGQALAALVDAQTVLGPVNVASGHPVSVRELAERIARRWQRPDLLRLDAMPARPGDAPSMRADITRLVDEVGFRPEHLMP